MKSIINKAHFIKAVEYANTRFFSTPYSISGMVDRWFNQLAMIEVVDEEGNSRIVHLSHDIAERHVDILVDDEIVNNDIIALIKKYKGKDASHEEERAKLQKKIYSLKNGLRDNLPNNTKTRKKQSELAETIKKLKLLDGEIAKANEWYKKIVEKGRTSLNIERFEKEFNGKITNIVYRPNHGLTHSVRTAYSVASILAYRQKCGDEETKVLKQPDIEKLQLMMLFSVVGRRDETGFNDGPDGCETYKSYRTASGREYLAYNREHSSHLYPGEDSLENLYRDALVVELMGYQCIKDAINRLREPPGLFVDYVREMENKLYGRDISREEALNLIARNVYSLDAFFQPQSVRAKSDALLNMMNDAHGLDLMRCYPLYPNTDNGPKIIKNLAYHLYQIDFFSFDDMPDGDKLCSFFQLLRNSFDTLEQTGQKTTFGLLSAKAFESQKEGLLEEIQAIATDFKDPSRRDDLLKEAKEAHAKDNTENYFESRFASPRNKKEEDALLDDYRAYKITHQIAEQLKEEKTLQPDKRMFLFNLHKPDDRNKLDHHASAASLVSALEALSPFPGVISSELPMVTKVEHDEKANEVTLYFKDEKNAKHFENIYKEMFGTSELLPNIKQDDSAQWVIKIGQTTYKQRS
ncbi:SidE phosphodiesterase domain-containing protein [Legionella impletisoli]|uniref:SidE PDE domain-containing protein n=1 Tax=Legionella impletisoli TaxID=343510 RepID=A0A917K116_9GAMM|nr:SidE phosphodiesterase domain-containing protein [Legionella impletisoli]GGI92065.1 hypothetical protein GCM10007966_20940 [Legionella impletisoli]